MSGKTKEREEKSKMKKKLEKTNEGKRVKNMIKSNKGITLIALVITIIVLLILARSDNCYVNRREWNFNKCTRYKGNKCVRKCCGTSKISIYGSKDGNNDAKGK